MAMEMKKKKRNESITLLAKEEQDQVTVDSNKETWM